jgi:hypothetical protein
MRRVRRFFTLAAPERRLLLRALWRLCRTCVRLRLVPEKKWQPMLQSRAAAVSSPARFSEEQVAWAVRAAARYVPAANCLPQAIVAKELLEEQGYQPTIRIGVRRPEESGLKAHAWVDIAGRVVLGEDGEHYSALGAGAAR